MPKLRFPGVPVYMNGQNYYIPSLSTRDFMEHEGELTKIIEGETAAQQIGRMVPVIGLAVRRNYPDVADDHLLDMLDVYTFRLAIKAVANAAGMEFVTEGE